MAAPIGNHNAKGSKGGGRSKRGDIQFLCELWDGKVKEEKLPKNSGKYQFYKKVIIEGDKVFLKQLVDKLYANPQYVETPDIGDALKYLWGGYEENSNLSSEKMDGVDARKFSAMEGNSSSSEKRQDNSQSQSSDSGCNENRKK